jgi:hypothetical protein
MLPSAAAAMEQHDFGHPLGGFDQNQGSR